MKLVLRFARSRCQRRALAVEEGVRHFGGRAQQGGGAGIGGRRKIRHRGADLIGRQVGCRHFVVPEVGFVDEGADPVQFGAQRAGGVVVGGAGILVDRAGRPWRHALCGKCGRAGKDRLAYRAGQGSRRRCWGWRRRRRRTDRRATGTGTGRTASATASTQGKA